jgi:hypothetical protein
MKRSILKGLTLKKRIFLSHAANEDPLAKALKKSIEKAFEGRVKVFVSSAIDDLQPGQPWLESLRKALTKSEALIVLCSPYSVTRPWVLLESGGAWVRNIPIISICHSGQKMEDLPPPLSFFQALELGPSGFFQPLLLSLANSLRLKEPSPVDEKPILEEIQAARKKIKKPVKTDPAGKAIRKPPKKFVFTKVQAAILRKIAKSNDEDCTCGKLASALRMDPNDLDIQLRYLTKHKLLTRNDVPGGEPIYHTTEKGLDRIVQHKRKRK